MNHRDRDREQLHLGRHGRDMERQRNDQARSQQDDQRYARGVRDTYTPEPQWLRQDREQRDDQQFESGIGGSQYGGSEYGYAGTSRGSYAGSGREWGENTNTQGYGRQGYGSQGYGASQGYGRQGAGTNRDFGGRDYGQRDQSRIREERDDQQRYSSFETAGWDDDLDTGSQRNYAPFHVGTGMGLGSSSGSEFAREPEFGTSYRSSSAHGSRGGWDLGTQQRDFGPGSTPSFRGMGPANYKRSDERIRDDIYERLTDSHVIDARGIMVDVNEGNVTLTGTVNERRMRYAAEDLVERIGGVANINNQLRVQSQEQTRAQGQPAPSTGKTLDENKRH
jgi:osmotically-inducible protein OsmY